MAVVVRRIACGALCLYLLGCDGDITPGPEPADTITAASAGFFRALSAGYYHACGLTPSGAVYCWGWASGIFGGSDAEHEAAHRPTQATQITGFDTISAGAGMLCGIAGGETLCWGANEFGELGVEGPSQMCGSLPCNPLPTPVAAVSAFRQVAAGGGHTCAVDAAGVAYCWGYGAYGRLGVEQNTNQGIPVAVNTELRFRAVAAAGTHSCGVALDGVAYCWGYGEGGQIGHGFSTTAQTTPARVAGDHTFTHLASGGAHNCALRLDGAAYCWGVNAEGQLGNGTTSNANVPVHAGTLPFVAVTAGGTHSCAIAANGQGYCWGDNTEGQLGDGTLIDRSVPTPISTELRFTQITAGYHFTCGLTTANTAVCWGLNYRGSLGTGLEELRATTPQRVAAPLP
ncbi:MAG TPA: hypothetical protein VFO52_05920 [Longimicrobiales bacterium]|nr:hypothetical protein [Longimicrobiales bacterium]